MAASRNPGTGSSVAAANSPGAGAGAGPRRIVVVGSSGSGKTTLAGEIGRRLGIPHIELDALHWEPNWVEAPLEVFRRRVAQAIATDAWVVDGNYSRARDLIWSRAELLVWLDYVLPVLLWRVVRRTVWRGATRAELWSGNRESLRNAFFSRDSIIWWTLTTYRGRRREYPAVLRQPEYKHLRVFHLHSPRQAHAWLAGLHSPSASVSRHQ